MTSSMHVSKVNALFRNLFVESRSFDLLFKQLVTTVVRNESIQCSSTLILETFAYLFSIGRQCRITGALRQKYNGLEQVLLLLDLQGTCGSVCLRHHDLQKNRIDFFSRHALLYNL
jgi:hypothetical protein